jgi:hypothetical protein
MNGVFFNSPVRIRVCLIGGLLVGCLVGMSGVGMASAIPIKDVATDTIYYIQFSEGSQARVMSSGDLLEAGLSSQSVVATPSILSVTFDGKSIQAEDYTKAQPMVAVTIAPGLNGDVASYNIQVVNVSSMEMVAATFSVLSPTSSVTIVPEFLVTPALAGGQRYQVIVRASDSVGGEAVYESEVFQVASQLRIAGAINGPNPFNPLVTPTHIEYQLSRDADVELHIYSVSGEKLWSQEMSSGFSGGSAGFNQVVWDGRNRYSEVVANGVYIAYIFAKMEGETSKSKIKIAVLK